MSAFEDVAAENRFQQGFAAEDGSERAHEVARGQAEPVFKDMDVDAVKTGMLPNREVITETAALIKEFGIDKVVVDPVVRSTSGFDLIDGAALKALIEMLFPLATVITPNIPEAERISGIAIESAEDVRDAAKVMRSMGAKNVLIKGGHLAADGDGPRMALDHLFIDGTEHVMEAEFIETTATHGTGCTLAASIAANLALGETLLDAAARAKAFVHEAIRTAPHIGRGHSPINIQPILR